MAWKNGVFDDEVVPVSIPQRKGDPIVVSTDEGVRGDTTAESLGKLRPAFNKEGTITAGSSSQISDGACAVVVMSKAKAEELGLEWLAEIGAHGQVAGPDSTLQLQPAAATAQGAARRRASAPTDLDLVEFNEAFAAVGISSARELGIDDEKVNVNGGAIALGHPVGMSGARIVLHLALELKRRGGGIGAAALCGGGGQGDALIVRVPRLTPTACRADGARIEGGRARPELVEQARAGKARAVARLISLVEDESPLLREVMAALAPHAGRAHVIGITGAPGVGKSTSTSALVTALCGGAASGSACSRSTRPRRSPAARCSVTGCGCRTTRPTPACSSGRWPPAATSAGWPGRRRRRCGSSTPPASTSCWSRPSASGRARSRSPGRPTRPSCCWRRAWATAIQAAKAGILEIGDVYVGQQGRPGRRGHGRVATCATCLRWPSGPRGVAARRCC